MGHDSERAALIYQHVARALIRESGMRSTSKSRPSATTRATMARPGRSSPLA